MILATKEMIFGDALVILKLFEKYDRKDFTMELAQKVRDELTDEDYELGEYLEIVPLKDNLHIVDTRTNEVLLEYDYD